MRILLVYYSGSGNSAAVAELLRDIWTEAGHSVDLQALMPRQPRSAPWDWWPVAKLTGRSVPLMPTAHAWEAYDFVCFGCGVRWFAPAQPLVSYLNQVSDFKGKPVAFYLTCGGMPSQAFRQLTTQLKDKGGSLVASTAIKPLSVIDGLLGRELGHIERFDLSPVQIFVDQVSQHFLAADRTTTRSTGDSSL